MVSIFSDMKPTSEGFPKTEVYIFHPTKCSLYLCLLSTSLSLEVNPIWNNRKNNKPSHPNNNVSSFVCEFIKYRTHISLKKSLENWSLFQKVHATDANVLTIYIQFQTIIVFWFDSPKSKFTAPMRPHVGCCVPYISP